MFLGGPKVIFEGLKVFLETRKVFHEEPKKILKYKKIKLDFSFTLNLVLTLDHPSKFKILSATEPS